MSVLKTQIFTCMYIYIYVYMYMYVRKSYLIKMHVCSIETLLQHQYHPIFLGLFICGGMVGYEYLITPHF